MRKIYLASRSPRRRELLDQIGVDFEIIDVDIDESWDGNETPRDFVSRLALEKARAGKAIAQEPLPVLAADTEVVLDDEIMGKPVDKDDVIKMLQKLSGRTQYVYSAVALIDEAEQVKVSTSLVCFKALTIDECHAYVETGEPMDKAGAYGIQGKAAAFISRMEGSYSGIMGLDLFEASELLKSLDQ